MSKECTCEKKKSGVLKFALGALVGAGVGILFAPDKGEVTRKKLQIKFNNLINKAKEIDVDEIREQLENKVDEIRYELEDLDKEKVLKVAKKKAKEIQEKCESLVELAIEKGTPVLEDAANEVKEQTIKVIKEVLDKLENKEKPSKK